MARLSYKGYNISCRPLKTDNLWQLEIEKSGGEADVEEEDEVLDHV